MNIIKNYFPRLLGRQTNHNANTNNTTTTSSFASNPINPERRIPSATDVSNYVNHLKSTPRTPRPTTPPTPIPGTLTVRSASLDEFVNSLFSIDGSSFVEAIVFQDSPTNRKANPTLALTPDNLHGIIEYCNTSTSPKLAKFKASIKEISFNTLNISTDLLESIANIFPNLQSLNINNCELIGTNSSDKTFTECFYDRLIKIPASNQHLKKISIRSLSCRLVNQSFDNKRTLPPENRELSFIKTINSGTFLTSKIKTVAQFSDTTGSVSVLSINCSVYS